MFQLSIKSCNSSYETFVNNNIIDTLAYNEHDNYMETCSVSNFLSYRYIALCTSCWGSVHCGPTKRPCFEQFNQGSIQETACGPT